MGRKKRNAFKATWRGKGESNMEIPCLVRMRERLPPQPPRKKKVLREILTGE